MDAKGAGMPITAGMPAARRIPATEVMDSREQLTRFYKNSR
jgi:hypothetical protein